MYNRVYQKDILVTIPVMAQPMSLVTQAIITGSSPENLTPIICHKNRVSVSRMHLGHGAVTMGDEPLQIIISTALVHFHRISSIPRLPHSHTPARVSRRSFVQAHPNMQRWIGTLASFMPGISDLDRKTSHDFGSLKFIINYQQILYHS